MLMIRTTKVYDLNVKHNLLRVTDTMPNDLNTICRKSKLFILIYLKILWF